MTKKIFAVMALVTMLSGSFLTNAAPASANFPDGTGAWADQVYSFLPGKTAGGTTIPADQQNAWQALGEAEGVSQTIISPTSGVSLGFRGQLTVKFTNSILNAPGADLRIVSVHDGAPTVINKKRVPLPTLRVQVSQNCWKWYTVGIIHGDRDVNLGSLHWASCVQITDISSMSAFMPKSSRATRYPDAVGFKIDGIQALHTTANTPWLGTVHDTRWFKIDDSTANDTWKGYSIKTHSRRNLGFCNSFYDQAITFHNNWIENNVYNGVFFRDAVYNTIGRSKWDGMTVDEIHTYINGLTCNLTAARDPKVRNLYSQLARINKGLDLWVTPDAQ